MDVHTITLALIASLAAIVTIGAVTMAKLVAKVRTLEMQALTDPLTGAFNRRHFEACLDAAIERRGRFGEPSCLVVFDVDRFKDINDALGHAAGDAVLKALVVLVRRCARKVDVLSRVGGEEFALLLAGAHLAAAVNIAEQIRALVSASRLLDGHALSISVGVSELRDGLSPLAWFEESDRALYSAKRSGRNRVVVKRPGSVLATAATR
jgi:diguanylate cyclase (GGDEF)-like protein